MGSTKLRKRGSDVTKMTDRERRFISEYLVDYNATRAARIAGYKSPNVQGTQLLQKDHISRAVGKLERDQVEENKLHRTEVLLQLAYCATRDGKDFVDEKGKLIPIQELNPRASACIDGIKQKVRSWTNRDGEEVEEIETELKLVGKAAAIDMAMKHKGLFAPVDNNVNVNLGQVLAALMGQIENSNVIDGQVIENKLEEK